VADFLQLPADGTGKRMHAHKSNVGGVDLYEEIQMGVPHNPVGVVPVDVPLQPVPEALTEIIAGDVALMLIWLVNTTEDALAVTIQSSAGIDLFPPAQQIPALAKEAVVFHGLKVGGGVRWQASGPGLNGAIVGYQAQ
jgi:hypothetical protein